MFVKVLIVRLNCLVTTSMNTTEFYKIFGFFNFAKYDYVGLRRTLTTKLLIMLQCGVWLAAVYPELTGLV